MCHRWGVSTNLVIRDQDRLVGQIESQNSPVSTSYGDVTDLIRRKGAMAVVLEGNDKTRRCEPLRYEN